MPVDDVVARCFGLALCDPISHRLTALAKRAKSLTPDSKSPPISISLQTKILIHASQIRIFAEQD